MAFLPPNQPRQSTEGTYSEQYSEMQIVTSWSNGRPAVDLLGDDVATAADCDLGVVERRG